MEPTPKATELGRNRLEDLPRAPRRGLITVKRVADASDLSSPYKGQALTMVNLAVLEERLHTPCLPKLSFRAPKQAAFGSQHLEASRCAWQQKGLNFSPS